VGGVVREIVLPWIRIRHGIGNTVMVMPYGRIDETVDFLCGPIPREMFAIFMEAAKVALPKECAAAFVWNQNTCAWRYEDRQAIEATECHILYKEVRLSDEEHLVVDIHSHGIWPAFFSEEDNKDDHGTMRLSVVLGFESGLTSAARLCMAGKFFPASLDAEGRLMVNL
jgi:PRTRC genetic system protein A